MANSGGKPPKYKNKYEIQEKIEQYFEDCKGEPLYNADGNPMIDKYGRPIMIGQKPPTITGLALALGFASRQALLNYQDRDEFNDTITRAKSRVEEYAESRLFDRDGSNGAQFSLRNNFKGWNGEQEGKTNEAAEIIKNMTTLAETIKKPVPNRDIEDYE